MENKGEKREQYKHHNSKYNRTDPSPRICVKCQSSQRTLDLDTRNIQKLARYQRLLHPRDVEARRPIPLPGGVELLDLLRVLHQNVVVLDRLEGGVFDVTHRFDVISPHSEDNTGKFARGFVLLVVIGIDLRFVIGWGGG